MSPKSDSTEEIVLNFVNENIADFLQKFNLKKTAIQKALDSLADNGRISFEEYGKQKIYLARQDQFAILAAPFRSTDSSMSCLARRMRSLPLNRSAIIPLHMRLKPCEEEETDGVMSRRDSGGAITV